jgi:hypothetical protein
VSRTFVSLVLVFALTARAAEPEPKPQKSVLSAVLIGAAGLALAGGYAAGAFVTGDRPSGFPLATVGGVVSGGLLGASLGLGINSQMKNPGSLVGYVLAPVISGLAGALIFGLLAGLASNQPGTLRTVTHVVVVSLVIGETVALEFTR